MTKKYRRIGEIAKDLGVTTSTIRFWEQKFPQLNPKKNRSGHRVYTLKDLEIIKLIHHYTHKEGFTLEGTMRKLEKAMPTESSKEFFTEVSRLIRDLKVLIDEL